MKTIIWKALIYEGMEHLVLDETETGASIKSVVIGVENHAAFRLDYILQCDEHYAVREVNLALNADSALRRLYMTSDGRGNWSDAEGEPLSAFDGCLDIDISTTPFTNTLPIRRIGWQVGQSEVLNMIYLLIPDLTPRLAQQRYTCIEQSTNGATFRYESLSSGFTALLPVDAAGLVLDYPKIWERVYLGADRG